MQLYDFLKDDTFNSLRHKMQAPLIDAAALPYRPGLTYIDIFEIFDGKEIDFSEIENDENGLLYHKGVLISLNIKDVNSLSGEENLPRLHISFCKTLQEMKDGGRFKRYITSCETSTEREIRFNNAKVIMSKLDVCRFCLDKLHWKEFHVYLPSKVKDKIVNEFDLKEFYKTYEPQFYSDFSGILYRESDHLPLNNYQKNWSAISYQYRKSKNWFCESCGNLFDKNKSNLHVHHINGIKSDNDLGNLRALCYTCHAKQPFHNHM